MPWSGRTQRSDDVDADASPQRIDLGHGKSRTIVATAPLAEGVAIHLEAACDDDVAPSIG